MECDLRIHTNKALEEFAFRAVVPLFCALGDDADHLATGTFIEINSKVLLLTARHILDACEPENIAIAKEPEGSGLQTLGSMRIHKPVDQINAEIDIIAFEILDDEVIGIIRSGWRIVDLCIGGYLDASRELILVGFPSATLQKKGSQIGGRPTCLITKVLPAVPINAEKPVNPELDMFLNLPSTAWDEGGKEVDVPPIKGMSGCAIWQISPAEKGGLWTVDREIKLVGIQSSAMTGHFLRGKNWIYIQHILSRCKD